MARVTSPDASSGQQSAAAGASLTGDLITTAAAIGAVAAGVALVESALIPGLVIGGAAILAPRFLPGLGRLARPMFGMGGQRSPVPRKPATGLRAMAAKLPVGRMVAKTVTFRIIVTSLDFTTNYIVIGELATAAGLSAFSLAAGPVFYFVHEALWHPLEAAVTGDAGRFGPAIEVPVRLPLGGLGGPGGITISRAIAKTITFRTMATVMDFTTNYVVVGNVATAVALSATGFVLGPFVYLGHEMAWERLGGTGRTVDAPVVSGGAAVAR